MTGEVFDIVRAAVTLAKTEQIRTTGSLRKRLLETHPGKDAEVAEALNMWASCASEQA